MQVERDDTGRTDDAESPASPISQPLPSPKPDPRRRSRGYRKDTGSRIIRRVPQRPPTLETDIYVSQKSNFIALSKRVLKMLLAPRKGTARQQFVR